MPASTPRPVFVYGTLRSPHLLAWVLTGASSNHTSIAPRQIPATITGFRSVAVKHSDYPALIQSTPSDIVEGYIIYPDNEAERSRLDSFEGETYKRITVQAVVAETGESVPAVGESVDVDVYMWDDTPEKLQDWDWDFDYFQKERLEDWLDLFDGFELV